MNKRTLSIILVVLGLFSVGFADHADEYGCITYGSDGFCNECASTHVLENY